MIKQQILQYFLHQKNEFDLNFEPAFSLNNEKAIHDMRVSIKRLRLLYRFLDCFLDKQFCAKKKAKLLVQAFKSAGPLRDAQIQLIILQDFKTVLKSDYTDLTELLQKKEDAGIVEFKKMAKLLDLNKINQIFSLSEATLKVIIKFQNLESAFNDYKKNRREKLNNLLKETKSKVDYHRLRKRIKDLTYLAEIQQIETEKDKNELIHLKLLGSKLGDWHDLEVFLNELSAINSKQKKTVEDYKEIVAKLKQQQQVIIDEFYMNYHGFS